MSSGALVSIVMPFLNVSPYLSEAIESVQAQSYPHWELLLVDDGATDGSTGIAQDYAAQDPGRIRWIEHPGHVNRGASASRNVALQHATGKYVALLDGDDVWLPNKLAEQVALLESPAAPDVLCGSTEFWYSWAADGSGSSQADRVVHVGLPDGTLLQPPSMLVCMLSGTIQVPCTCSLIARREIVERVGGFEEEFRRVFTDQSFYAKLFLVARVLIVDTCWDRYRIHPASSCATAENSGELSSAREQYLRWLKAYLGKQPHRSVRVDAALRRANRIARFPRTYRLFWSVARAIREVAPRHWRADAT